jgi:hypothetical protein
MKHKLAVLAVLAVFFVISCQNPLETTSPSNSPIKAAASFEKGAIPPANYYNDISFDVSAIKVGTAVTGTNSPQTIITVTFPDGIGLDLLAIPVTDTARFEEKLKEILSFNKLTAVSDNTPYTVSPGTNIDYKVVNRESNVVYLDLAIDGGTSDKIEAVINAAKYTYKGGNLVDNDNNGIPGETYDNHYELLAINGGTAPATGTSYVPHNPTEGSFTFTYGWYYIAGTTLTSVSTDNTFILGGSSGSPYLIIEYSGANLKDTFDYSAALDKMITIQRYDLDQKKYVDIGSNRGAITRAELATGSYTHSYRIPLTLTHKDVLRVLVSNKADSTGKKLTTNDTYYGFQQRFYLDSTNPDIEEKTVLSGYAQNSSYANNSNSSFFSSSSSYVSVDQTGKNGVVVLGLDLTGGSSGPIGNLGLNPIPANTTEAELNTMLKVGYTVNGDTYYIPIKKVSLDFSLGATGNIEDELRLVLDPSFNVHAVSAVTIYAREELKYRGDSGTGAGVKPAGTFGDYTSITFREGYAQYGSYGDISDIRGYAAAPNFPAPPGLEGVYRSSSDGSAELFMNGNVFVTYSRYTTTSYAQSVFEDDISSTLHSVVTDAQSLNNASTYGVTGWTGSGDVAPIYQLASGLYLVLDDAGSGSYNYNVFVLSNGNYYGNYNRPAFTPEFLGGYILDGSGNTVATYSLDAFGQCTVTTNNGSSYRRR